MSDGIDWAALHRRVEAIGASLRGEGDRPEQGTAEVLAQRARRLAAVADTVDRGAERPLVTVRIAGETFAVDAEHVLEVARLPQWAPYPGAQPPLAGVAAWRGGLLTLYQLSVTLGLPQPAPGAAGWALVLGDQARACGVLVDAPGEFLLVPESDFRSSADPAGPSPQWVRAFTSDGVAVLDGASLLRLHH